MHVIGRHDQRQQRLLCGVTGYVDCFGAEYLDGLDSGAMVMERVVVLVKQFG